MTAADLWVGLGEGLPDRLEEVDTSPAKLTRGELLAEAVLYVAKDVLDAL